MRVRSRWVLGVCGLAMSATAGSTATAQVATPTAPMPSAAASAPATGPGAAIPLSPAEESKSSMPPGLAGMPPVWGGPLTGHSYTPGSKPVEMPPASTSLPSAPAPANAAAAEMAGHHHRGLFGARHCVECQRARVKKMDGVDIPPPPSYPAGMPMAAGATVVEGPVVMSGPSAPGYAVVGGSNEPGYATTDGMMPSSEPAPIGMARSSLGAAPAADPRMAAMMARRTPGSYDPSVMATSVPPPPAPMPGVGHNRPHIISHMLRPSMYLMHHRESIDRRREKHAAEAYGTTSQPVNDLPASMVYSRH